jgi:hypothetical protein
MWAKEMAGYVAHIKQKTFMKALVERPERRRPQKKRPAVDGKLIFQLT